MDQQPPREDSPCYNDPPHVRHATPSNPFRRGWNPIAPTPDVGCGSPGSPGPVSPVSPPRTARVSFVPAPAYPGAAAGAQAPSDIGLGIDPASRAPGYHAVDARDPYQVFPDDDDDGPQPPADPSSKTEYQQPQQYLLASPNDREHSSQQYGGPPPPPGGHDETRFCFNWRLVGSAWPMYFMFFLGFAFAAGHHALYEYLDRQPADDQIKMMRFGSLLSYACKSSLLAAVIFAYRQQVWVTARRKVLKLKTVDSLFAAVDEPLAMLNLEFISKAKMAVALAVLAWLVLPRAHPSTTRHTLN